jgi:fructokinase
MSSEQPALVAAIEAGGTKFVCGVGTGPDDLEATQFPTGEQPAQVLSAVVAWLAERQRRRGVVRAIGVGSFGPIELHPASPRYGHVTSTPKVGWRDADVLGPLKAAFPGVPLAFDTDVNAAALGESRWGNARGLGDFVYITIGTGIGAGALSGGQLVHGLLHPEMGHMRLPRSTGDAFAGACPFHGDCWEGLCSGPALEKQHGARAEDLPAEHRAWPLAAEYVGAGIANIVYVLSPERVILGGSVPKAGHLGHASFLGLVRRNLQRTLNGYIDAPELTRDIDAFVVPPGLGDRAGICGALALGQLAAAR